MELEVLMGSGRTAEVRELTLRVPEEELTTLYAQLRAYREGRSGTGELGGLIPRAFVDELLTYWADGYDWRAHEARLAAYDHFGTRVAGQFVHFLHVRGRQPDAVPVLLTHEWPSGVMDVVDAAAPLAASGDYHVVIPSISWSALTGPGPAGRSPSRRSADGWAELMDRLGHDDYRVGDDRTGIGAAPAYTLVDGSVEEQPVSPAAQVSAPRGLSEPELAEVRWFTENLSAVNQRQQVNALVLSTALLLWNAQLAPVEVDRDAVITGVMLACFAARLAGLAAE